MSHYHHEVSLYSTGRIRKKAIPPKDDLNQALKYRPQQPRDGIELILVLIVQETWGVTGVTSSANFASLVSRSLPGLWLDQYLRKRLILARYVALTTSFSDSRPIRRSQRPLAIQIRAASSSIIHSLASSTTVFQGLILPSSFI